ncbi:uncharacterized protein LOC143230026 [Tachypleus tridentatus]|uniref:uncharacterized protein LOC143230026 n=1 Tax=Tachypleus tridentatus TaxID=6853 RepID=UPI003FD408B7
MSSSSFVAFALISGIVSNRLPFKGLLSLGNKKKSQGARSVKMSSSSQDLLSVGPRSCESEDVMILGQKLQLTVEDYQGSKLPETSTEGCARDLEKPDFELIIYSPSPLDELRGFQELQECPPPLVDWSICFEQMTNGCNVLDANVELKSGNGYNPGKLDENHTFYTEQKCLSSPVPKDNTCTGNSVHENAYFATNVAGSKVNKNLFPYEQTIVTMGDCKYDYDCNESDNDYSNHVKETIQEVPAILKYAYSEFCEGSVLHECDGVASLYRRNESKLTDQSSDTETGKSRHQTVLDGVKGLEKNMDNNSCNKKISYMSSLLRNCDDSSSVSNRHQYNDVNVSNKMTLNHELDFTTDSCKSNSLLDNSTQMSYWSETNSDTGNSNTISFSQKENCDYIDNNFQRKKLVNVNEKDGERNFQTTVNNSQGDKNDTSITLLEKMNNTMDVIVAKRTERSKLHHCELPETNSNVTLSVQKKCLFFRNNEIEERNSNIQLSKNASLISKRFLFTSSQDNQIPVKKIKTEENREKAIKIRDQYDWDIDSSSISGDVKTQNLLLNKQFQDGEVRKTTLEVQIIDGKDLCMYDCQNIFQVQTTDETKNAVVNLSQKNFQDEIIDTDNMQECNAEIPVINFETQTTNECKNAIVNLCQRNSQDQIIETDMQECNAEIPVINLETQTTNECKNAIVNLCQRNSQDQIIETDMQECNAKIPVINFETKTTDETKNAIVNLCQRNSQDQIIETDMQECNAEIPVINLETQTTNECKNAIVNLCQRNSQDQIIETDMQECNAKIPVINFETKTTDETKNAIVNLCQRNSKDQIIETDMQECNAEIPVINFETQTTDETKNAVVNLSQKNSQDEIIDTDMQECNAEIPVINFETQTTDETKNAIVNLCQKDYQDQIVETDMQECNAEIPVINFETQTTNECKNAIVNLCQRNSQDQIIETDMQECNAEIPVINFETQTTDETKNAIVNLCQRNSQDQIIETDMQECNAEIPVINFETQTTDETKNAVVNLSQKNSQDEIIDTDMQECNAEIPVINFETQTTDETKNAIVNLCQKDYQDQIVETDMQECNAEIPVINFETQTTNECKNAIVNLCQRNSQDQIIETDMHECNAEIPVINFETQTTDETKNAIVNLCQRNSQDQIIETDMQECNAEIPVINFETQTTDETKNAIVNLCQRNSQDQIIETDMQECNAEIPVINFETQTTDETKNAFVNLCQKNSQDQIIETDMQECNAEIPVINFETQTTEETKNAIVNLSKKNSQDEIIDTDMQECNAEIPVINFETQTTNECKNAIVNLCQRNSQDQIIETDMQECNAEIPVINFETQTTDETKNAIVNLCQKNSQDQIIETDMQKCNEEIPVINFETKYCDQTNNCKKLKYSIDVSHTCHPVQFMYHTKDYNGCDDNTHKTILQNQSTDQKNELECDVVISKKDLLTQLTDETNYSRVQDNDDVLTFHNESINLIKTTNNNNCTVEGSEKTIPQCQHNGQNINIFTQECVVGFFQSQLMQQIEEQEYKKGNSYAFTDETNVCDKQPCYLHATQNMFNIQSFDHGMLKGGVEVSHSQFCDQIKNSNTLTYCGRTCQTSSQTQLGNQQNSSDTMGFIVDGSQTTLQSQLTDESTNSITLECVTEPNASGIGVFHAFNKTQINDQIYRYNTQKSDVDIRQTVQKPQMNDQSYKSNALKSDDICLTVLQSHLIDQPHISDTYECDVEKYETALKNQLNCQPNKSGTLKCAINVFKTQMTEKQDNFDTSKYDIEVCQTKHQYQLTDQQNKPHTIESNVGDCQIFLKTQLTNEQTDADILGCDLDVCQTTWRTDLTDHVSNSDLWDLKQTQPEVHEKEYDTHVCKMNCLTLITNQFTNSDQKKFSVGIYQNVQSNNEKENLEIQTYQTSISTDHKSTKLGNTKDWDEPANSDTDYPKKALYDFHTVDQPSLFMPYKKSLTDKNIQTVLHGFHFMDSGQLSTAYDQLVPQSEEYAQKSDDDLSKTLYEKAFNWSSSSSVSQSLANKSESEEVHSRPLRIGLSRRQKVKSLHPYLFDKAS